MFLTLLRLYNNFVYPKPPTNASYGFRWQAGQGVPNQLSVFDMSQVGSGIYVAFPAHYLDATYDPFGRLGAPGPGPVFVVPGAPSAAMTSLIDNVKINPPVNQGPLFFNVTNQRLRDLTGFLTYAATCLNIINNTAAGVQLFNRINNAPRPVFITPANPDMTGVAGNQTFPGPTAYVNTLTSAIKNYAANQPMPVQQIVAIVNQRYAAINGTLARFNQLATDMNNLPLCSLFVDQAAFTPNFLHTYFRFEGNRFTGQNLLTWLSAQGFPRFDLNLRNFNNPAHHVQARVFFLLALNIVLYGAVPPGAGSGATITFHVRNEGQNRLASPDFRPPAIGLAHELMHAMHYGYGTSPGWANQHFTTTAAELLFSGIGPFAAEPITENAIRGQWATIPAVAIDASNVWGAPALRTIYTPPIAPQTPRTLRALEHCI